MKTLKIITFAAIALLGLASCSDEQKALNFVSKEVVTENNLNDFLIRYKIMEFRDSFEPEIRGYLNSIREKGSNPNVYLSDKYAHGDYQKWDDGRIHIVKGQDDYWEYYHPLDSIDSDMILNTILFSILKRIDTLLADDTLKYQNSNFNSMSKEDMFNNIISKAVRKSFFVTNDELVENGLDPYKDINRKLREAHEYDWNLLGGQSGQSLFIDDIVYWAVGKCRDEVMSINYKLVDKQSTTVGENHFEITYLLEPKLEIHFDVSKVGKTFVLNSSRVY